jgi:hypothetical protein
MHGPTRFEFHHHKDIPLPKQPVLNNRKVTSPHRPGFALQESRPGLACRARSHLFWHVVLDAAFTHFRPRFQWFPTSDSPWLSFVSSESFPAKPLACLATSTANRCETTPDTSAGASPAGQYAVIDSRISWSGKGKRDENGQGRLAEVV